MTVEREKPWLAIEVQDQDNIHGKDPVFSPPKNVYDRIDNDNTPTLPPERVYRWNIVLDWSAAPRL
jgi:hypothetical protein